ncbi:MAG: transposase [Anaerolineae bacterium]|nr:transposase [Anaerolineae bacterium]
MGSKYRQFTPEFKLQVVLDLLSGTKTMAQLCREHHLKDSVVYRWKQQFIERAALVFAPPGKANPEEARVAELERMVGRLTMELEAVKKASNLLNSR